MLKVVYVFIRFKHFHGIPGNIIPVKLPPVIILPKLFQTLCIIPVELKEIVAGALEYFILPPLSSVYFSFPKSFAGFFLTFNYEQHNPTITTIYPSTIIDQPDQKILEISPELSMTVTSEALSPMSPYRLSGSSLLLI